MSGTDRVRVGDKAPDFTLLSDKGEPVRLADFLGRSAVVLYFYPKDNTPGCTAESCEFRDSYEDFVAAGAEVIGVSSDSVESHVGFRDKFKLPFTLLSDPDGKVRELYGVKSTLWVLPGRVTFVIDRDGIVRHYFSSQLQATRHVGEALGVLRRITSGKPAAAPGAS